MAMSSVEEEVHQIRTMLRRGRLAVDECDGARAAFLTHIGAQPRLVPGPWIAQRKLVMALALANLSPAQRASLAHTIIVDWGREFGVGRLVLTARPSGLPLGGSSLSLRPRAPGGEGRPHLLYSWGLGPSAEPQRCDWLLLRAQPGWALDAAQRAIGVRGLETLAQLGGRVLVLVPGAVAARQVAEKVGGTLAIDAHPRFIPFLDEHQAEATLLLWPHDAIHAASLAKREFSTLVLIGAADNVREEVLRWSAQRPGLELVDAACPGRMDRAALARFWEACARPKILLRGDPAWSVSGRRWLESLGAEVATHAEATQLGLF